MKKIVIFIGIILLLNVNASTEPILLSQELEEGSGGNPEVYIAHQCLKSKISQKCLEKLFNDERNIYLESYDIIKLASRSESVEKATITFHDDELFLLYLDTSNVETPLNINITSTKESNDGNSVLFMLPVKDIDKKIVIKDNKGNVVLQYKVIKKLQK